MTQTSDPSGLPLPIIAKLKAKPGQEQEVFGACHALLASTRAEQGCIHYDMHRSTEDPAVTIFHKNWITRPLWDAHMSSPHLMAFSAATADTVELWDIFRGEQVRG